MRHLTVRNVPKELARQLDQERLRSGKSLNQTIIDLLSQATGVTRQVVPDNGLGRLAGTWTDSDVQEFEQATRPFQSVDEEMWR